MHMELPSFIVDVHLGKLARMLRMLGFDTLYQNDFTIPELTSLAQRYKRVLLSRSTALTKLSDVSVLIIEGKDPDAQLMQVLHQYNLQNSSQPFTRCIACNGVLQAVPKQDLLHLLQPETIKHFDEFWQCSDCERVYWKGSHYERMLARISSIANL